MIFFLNFYWDDGGGLEGRLAVKSDLIVPVLTLIQTLSQLLQALFPLVIQEACAEQLLLFSSILVL